MQVFEFTVLVPLFKHVTFNFYLVISASSFRGLPGCDTLSDINMHSSIFCVELSSFSRLKHL